MTGENEKLNSELDSFLHDLSYRIKEETKGQYNPTAFRQMLHDKGGLQTVKYLINKKRPSKGYITLSRLKRLGLTVEAQILCHHEFHTLFTEEELERCHNRLKDYDYYK